MTEKTATVFLIDRNYAMMKELQLVFEIVESSLIQKVHENRKGDQIGIILIGGSKTHNLLFDDLYPEEYSNILDLTFSKKKEIQSRDETLADDEIKPLCQPTAKIIIDFKNECAKPAEKENQSGDLVDGLILGVKNILIQTTSARTKKPLKYKQKKLVLFTNGQTEVDNRLVVALNEQTEAHDIKIVLVGCGQLDDKPKGPTWDILRSISEIYVKDTQVINSAASDKKIYNSVTNRVFLRYGNITTNGSDRCLAIPVLLRNKTLKEKLPTAKKYSPNSALQEGSCISTNKSNQITNVTLETTFHLPPPFEADDHVTDTDTKKKLGKLIPRDLLVDAFAYGNHYVPVTEADMESIKSDTVKSVDIIKFTPSENVKRETYMGPVVAICPDTSSSSAGRQLGALLSAMKDEKHVAIVRMQRTDKGSSILGVLEWMEKGYGYITSIPWKQDLRNWRFMETKDIEEAVGFGEKRKRGQELMDSLVEIGTVTGSEILWPKRMRNPTLVNLQRCIAKRATEGRGPATKPHYGPEWGTTLTESPKWAKVVNELSKWAEIKTGKDQVKTFAAKSSKDAKKETVIPEPSGIEFDFLDVD